MCSVEYYKAKEQNSLRLSDYKRIAREIAKLGGIAVNILGGEPLSYPNIVELVNILYQEHLFVNIVSNGILATSDLLADLKKAGAYSIFFSLDSLGPKTNDSIRGTGSHQKVMTAIEDAQALGFEVGISVVYFSGELGQAKKVMDFCQERGLTIGAGQVAMVGAASPENLLSPEEHNQIRMWLKQYPKLVCDWAFSYFFKQRCPAGKEKLGITNSGDVIACSVNPLSFGNIKYESLNKIWRRMSQFSQFAKDSPICLAAEDTYYINKYLMPANHRKIYPISYLEHPEITPQNEPGLFTMKNVKCDPPCIVCGSSTFLVLYNEIDDYEYNVRHRALKLVRCRNCGLVRLEPLPTDDELASYYTDDYANIFIAQDPSPLRRAMMNIYNHLFIKSVSHLLPRQADILDVGCAAGHMMDILSNHNPDWRVTGVEINEEAVRIGREAGRNIIHGAIEDVEIPDQKFDLILLSHLIEHVTDPPSLLRKLAGLLKPGGRIVIETPNTAAADFKIFGRFWGGLHYPRHTYLFAPHNFVSLLRQCGLEAERIVQTLNIFGWALSAQNFLSSKIKIKKVRGRASFYPALMLASLPIVALQKAFGNTCCMKVIARLKR
jgi:MoaA/NifB/PqqE/SkfB family radical SAM enzyme/2-polyprenyl-3-methyl-5-hydroxy-6-metoxy-1,4-benzoquinol methylase